MPISTVPGFIDASSSGVGARTLSTMSAANASATDPIAAPAATYAASGALAASPAPDCTSTWWPAATSFLTVSGVAATRASPARVSAGTPILIVVSPEGCLQPAG